MTDRDQRIRAIGIIDEDYWMVLRQLHASVSVVLVDDDDPQWARAALK